MHNICKDLNSKSKNLFIYCIKEEIVFDCVQSKTPYTPLQKKKNQIFALEFLPTALFT